MKKIFILLFATLFTSQIYSQELNTDISRFGTKPIIEISDLPVQINLTPLNKEIEYGQQLIHAGNVTLGLGAGCFLFGTVLYVAGTSVLNDYEYSYNKRLKLSSDLITSGLVFYGVGGSLVTVSIPFYACGYTHKKVARTQIEIWEPLKYKTKW